MEDGLFPDPEDCRGFIKCAQVRLVLWEEEAGDCVLQGSRYPMLCGGGLYFDPVTYNCNWAWATQCNGRPLGRRI